MTEPTSPPPTGDATAPEAPASSPRPPGSPAQGQQPGGLSSAGWDQVLSHLGAYELAIKRGDAWEPDPWELMRELLIHHPIAGSQRADPCHWCHRDRGHRTGCPFGEAVARLMVHDGALCGSCSHPLTGDHGIRRSWLEGGCTECRVCYRLRRACEECGQAGPIEPELHAATHGHWPWRAGT